MNNLKKTSTDRKWIGLIIFLLIAEIIWLFADLQWINLPIFLKKLSGSSTKEAGHVLSSKNDLKRRGVNSLIWEKTRDNEILYYHDSVLTLSQSSAKLYLKDQTELQLSENTLVSLEEPEDKTKSEIRLRFYKGDFKARNPSARTAIQGEDWYINLEKGSEVNLRKDLNSYEFEVLSGQATLQTAAGTENLNHSSIVKFGGDQKIIKIGKSQSLQWLESKPLRVYTFEDSTGIPLEWAGQATGINISRVSEAEITRPVLAQQKSAEIELKLGSYNIRLADENGVSAARTIEVWKAPRIFLKKPLPRDRLKVGEDYEFVWTAEENVKEYQIKLLDQSGIRSESTSQNFKVLRFDKEQDLDWKIEARDDEGYLIPSLYQNKIYLRAEPLQAPKLKAPSIQVPHSSGKSGFFNWFRLLLPEAQAASEKNNQEILFEWEAVVGANYYTIEISSDSGFRQPEVVENSTVTNYVWKKFDPKKKYYWRVAAANSSGRMGLFSEQVEVEPNLVKKSLQLKEPAKEIPEKITSKIEEPVKTAEVFNLPSVPLGWGMAWAPFYRIAALPGDLNSKIRLQGSVPFGALLEYQTQLTDEKHFYNVKFWGGSQAWKSAPEAEYPFQENLDISESWLHISRGDAVTGSMAGLSLHQSFIPLRKTEETVSFRSVVVVGARYAIKNFAISIGTSGDVHELNFELNYKKYFSDSNIDHKIRFYYGAAGNLLYQNNKSGSGYQGNLIFLLGLDQF